MATDPRVIKVFLASPSDLTIERERVRDAVERLNRGFAKEANVFILLLGWEDTLPGIGRPQSLINEDIRQCELFLGLLWKRWGSPTGDWTSGFEEEYQLASVRYAAEGSPEVWLAFKKLPEGQDEDPGDQLKQVIAFRQKVEASRTVLYKEFTSAEDLEAQLLNWLGSLLIKHVRDELSAGSPVQAPAPTLGTRGFAPAGQPLSGQRQEPLANAQIANMLLSTKALVYDRLQTQLLTTHEINILYRFRQSIQPNGRERDLLFRSMFSAPFDVNPGWYWFREFESEDVVRYLVQVGANDDELRRPVLSWLGEHGDSVLNETLLSALATAPDREMTGIVYQFIDYSKSSAGDLIDQLSAAHGDLGQDGRIAAALIHLNREFRGGGIEEIARLPQISPRWFQPLHKLLKQLGDQDVETWLTADSAWLRRAAAITLYERGALTASTAELLKTDRSLSVREIGIKRLVELEVIQDIAEIRSQFVVADAETSLGDMVEGSRSGPDSSVRTLLARETTEQLRLRLDWLSQEAAVAYEYIHTRVYGGPAPLLQDLDSQFRDLRTATLRRYEQEHGSVGVGALEKALESIDPYIISLFRAAALRVAAARDPSPFLRHAHDVLADFTDVSGGDAAAMEILSTAGGPSELMALLAIAKSGTTGSNRVLGPLATLVNRHMPKWEDLDLTDDLAGSVIRKLEAAAIRHYREHIYGLLWSQHDATRVRALAALLSVMDQGEVADLLEAYLSKLPYFYNVVTWLDRILYAPQVIASSNAALLRSK